MTTGPGGVPCRMRHPAPAQGLAALSVVMVLFFIMALVAAYTNRNLIFEQRVAGNSYRAEQALAAADGAADWAILMLNSGRVNMACAPSTNAGDAPPRQRFMTRTATGGYLPILVTGVPLYASCVNKDAALTCVCPTAATPDPSPHAVKNWPLDGGGSAFRVNLAAPGGAGAQPGSVMLDIRGCGTPGTGNSSCGAATAQPAVDGNAHVRQLLGLVRALPMPPPATLTVGGDVQAGGAALHIGNPDAQSALTVHAGGTLSAGGSSTFQGPAGTADNGQALSDGALAANRPSAAQRFTANDLFFRSVFGMEAPTYRRQPAVVRINCTAAACTATDLRTALDRYPGLTVWFDGDLSLGTVPAGGSLGTATDPAMVVVTGTLTVAAAVELHGFFYARDVQWAAAGATASLQGALVVVDDFNAAATATLVYDAAALQTIQMHYGSFVRVPGGWNRPM